MRISRCELTWCARRSAARGPRRASSSAATSPTTCSSFAQEDEPSRPLLPPPRLDPRSARRGGGPRPRRALFREPGSCAWRVSSRPPATARLRRGRSTADGAALPAAGEALLCPRLRRCRCGGAGRAPGRRRGARLPGGGIGRRDLPRLAAAGGRRARGPAARSRSCCSRVRRALPQHELRSYDVMQRTLGEFAGALEGERSLVNADLPGADPLAVRVLGAPGVRAPAALRPRGRAPAPCTRTPSCACSAPSRGASAYVQPSRRPADGRYGDNPFRLGKHYQFQVILKPSPLDVQELYVRSLEAMGVDLRGPRPALRGGQLGGADPRRLGRRLAGDARRHGDHPVHLLPAGRRPRARRRSAPRSPTASSGSPCSSASRSSIYDIDWVPGGVSYGQVRHQEEVEFSKYYFEVADVDFLRLQLDG